MSVYSVPLLLVIRSCRTAGFSHLIADVCSLNVVFSHKERRNEQLSLIKK